LEATRPAIELMLTNVGDLTHALVGDGDHSVPLVGVRADHGTEEHQACVVDQGVEASEPGDSLLYGVLGLGAIGDVGLNYERGAARGLDLGRQRLQAVAAPGNERDGGAVGSEPARGGGADPAARAGDEGNGTGELRCRVDAVLSVRWIRRRRV
jgi:hypothetical protein